MSKDRDEVFDLDQLLHPAGAYEDPAQVLSDPDLTINEKRAILSSWASDACAIEAVPGLRELPSGRAVSFDDIMDALRSLDTASDQQKKYRKLVRRRRIFGRSTNNDKSGSPLH